MCNIGNYQQWCTSDTPMVVSEVCCTSHRNENTYHMLGNASDTPASLPITQDARQGVVQGHLEVRQQVEHELPSTRVSCSHPSSVDGAAFSNSECLSIPNGAILAFQHDGVPLEHHLPWIRATASETYEGWIRSMRVGIRTRGPIGTGTSAMRGSSFSFSTSSHFFILLFAMHSTRNCRHLSSSPCS